MREDFGRQPFAQFTAAWEDYIPAIPDGSGIDNNSPDSEVQFNDDDNARRRSICIDWHNNNGEKEIEIVAGYNSVRRELLNEALKENMAVHGPVKTLAVTMATQNARAHALFFTKHGFTRTADRSRTTWTYVADIEEQKLRKRERPRANLVDVKATPASEPKVIVPEPTMSTDQYKAALERKAALDEEIERLRAQKESQ